MSAQPSIGREKLTDAEVEWASERTRYYIRRGCTVSTAIERALADLRALGKS
jgi:hypothetical protein